MTKETRKNSIPNTLRVMVVTVTAILLQIMISASSTAVLAQGNQESSRHRAAGAVFAMTNATTDNEIAIYTRFSNGTLDRLRNVSTRGLGIGVDLDTQGGLRLSQNNRFLMRSTPVATMLPYSKWTELASNSFRKYMPATSPSA